jgi:hypothetical protein
MVTRVRAASCVVLVTLAALSACGRIQGGGAATASPTATSPDASLTPSPSSTPSPTSTPTNSPNALRPGDCTYPGTGGTRTPPVPDTFQTAISVPNGWTRQDTSHTDLPFKMTAPATYLYVPTEISVSAPMPTDPGQSPSVFMTRMAQGTVTVTVAPQPCAVGKDPAAFLSFTSGATVGYWVLWFHFGDAYLLQLKGKGGVDQRAVEDAKGVLASVTYAHDVPPPGYLPSPTS